MHKLHNVIRQTVPHIDDSISKKDENMKLSKKSKSNVNVLAPYITSESEALGMGLDRIGYVEKFSF